MPRLLLIVGIWLLTLIVVEAQHYTISGYINDRSTKEILIGATIFDARSGKGASTNSYGFYSLTLPAREVKVKFQSVGYSPYEDGFHLTKDTVMNISLSQTASELEEVVVTARQGSVDAKHGVTHIPIEKIRNTPALFGESDLMKSLQYIPGVQNATEGKSDLSVRGGSPDQNLVLLDGNPLYNINHLFGFLSVFNTDALKNVTLYKSAFPARFGGRLSSVVDINTKDGNKQKFGGSVTAGLLASKFSMEGPIVKDKTSFTLSARRSYADLFMGKLQEWIDETSNSRESFYFYDFNAKLHHKVDDKTSFYVVAYNGKDSYKNRIWEKDIPGERTNSIIHQDWSWGNTILATRFNRALTSNLFMNANLSYNRYAYRIYIDEKFNLVEDEKEKSVRNTLHYDSGIRDYTGNLEWEYIPSANHYVRAGTQLIRHHFKPEAFRFSENAENRSPAFSSAMIKATETAVYAEDEWNLIRQLTLNGGLRFATFHAKGKTYTALDTRASIKYLLGSNTSIKAGYSHMQQYIHLLSNNSLLFQTDLWVPVTDKVKPMNSVQYSLGVYQHLNKLFDFSVETYYKTMENVIEYRDGASFSGSPVSWEEKVEAGEGRSYGVEFSVEKQSGRVTGTASYAWAKTERRFDKINDGEWFPARFDRRHTANIYLSYRLNRKIDFTTQWTYTSGDMMTIPLMTVITPDIPDAMGIIDDLTQLDHRNNYRMPAYHRLDVGMNYTRKKDRSTRYGVWNFSIYNLYNRMNAFKIYVVTDVNKDATGRNIYTRQLKKITLFPVLPSLSYTYYF
ncbi:TonB-dependent receptor [Proteiniphilum sp.]|uniref:TonB-dependent receptor n=1 Tax=Proteiniphilum sp. TaxID=1926877 RepID=UPI002B21F18F|nr:TonB-dependent receptor [Proteiniphilum sp.]MEA4917331.1 TonB-dependent receptor [Proteiniphilum sp.]